MDAVAQTAYYCCGVRAADARLPSPICGDTFAERFMTVEGRAAFAPFAGLNGPNASNATRARIIDDLLRQRLAANPRQLILLVGAGFDTRAYRLGGGEWVEFDQPALLDLKNRLLPVSECSVPLTRVAIDFVREQLAERLAPFAGTPDAVVVVEGVTMYLTQEQQHTLFKTLRDALPGVTLICDLMTHGFAEKVALPFRRVLRTLGTDFVLQAKEPQRVVLESGFALAKRISILGRARELGAVSIPGFLFNTVLRTIRDGYGIHVFTSPLERRDKAPAAGYQAK